MAMRVYELAKKLGIENRVLIPELKKMGVSVSSHSSALDDDIVRKVLDKLDPKSISQGKADGEAAKSGHHDASSTKVTTAKTQPVEEPQKPDKRRILIKRKKEEEPLEVATPSPAPLVGETESPVPVAPVIVEASPAVISVEPVGASVVEEVAAPVSPTEVKVDVVTPPPPVEQPSVCA